MSKHTPGPWMCRAYPQVVDLPKASKMIVIESDDENSYHIGFACSWIDNPETAKEAMANARLIAAAPDMLEALIDVRRALELANFTGELAVVDAAISRAKGGD